MSHFVYIIAVERGDDLGPVKVGIAADVSARLSTLRTASPYPLRIVHMFAVPNKEIAREIEKTFHEVQAAHRTHGEWFDFTPVQSLQLLCMCIEVMLAVNLHWDQENINIAKEMCGIGDAEKKLIEWGECA